VIYASSLFYTYYLGGKEGERMAGIPERTGGIKGGRGWPLLKNVLILPAGCRD
jgi:hypothetical protein